VLKTYRKKTLIQAEQYLDKENPPPGIITDTPECDKDRLECPLSAHIHTREGPLSIELMGWIATGVEGEQYPIDEAIFEKTYEEA